MTNKKGDRPFRWVINRPLYPDIPVSVWKPTPFMLPNPQPLKHYGSSMSWKPWIIVPFTMLKLINNCSRWLSNISYPVQYPPYFQSFCCRSFFIRHYPFHVLYIWPTFLAILLILDPLLKIQNLVSFWYSSYLNCIYYYFELYCSIVTCIKAEYDPFYYN